MAFVPNTMLVTLLTQALGTRSATAAGPEQLLGCGRPSGTAAGYACNEHREVASGALGRFSAGMNE